MRLLPAACGLVAVFAGTQVYALNSERKEAVVITRCDMTEKMVNWWDPAANGRVEEQSFSYVYPAPPVSKVDQLRAEISARINRFLDKPVAEQHPNESADGAMIGTSHADTLNSCLRRAEKAGPDLVEMHATTSIYAKNSYLKGLWQPLQPTAFGHEVTLKGVDLPLNDASRADWKRIVTDAESGAARIAGITGYTP